MCDLSQEKMAAEDLPTVWQRKYITIFTTDYNLGFHKPENDLCDMCMEFESMSEASNTEPIKSENKKDIGSKNEGVNLKKPTKLTQTQKILP